MRTNEQPILVIFSGLPGTGKSTVAQRMARKLGFTYLRIDTIEQAIRDLCSFPVEGEGYRLAYRIATDNLKVGASVVADSCNPIELTRNEWKNVARNSGADFVNIEICCSDRREHRNRVEARISSIPGLRLPTWTEVEMREYHSWTRARIVVDTSGKTVDQSLEQICEIFSEEQRKKAKPGNSGNDG